MTNIIERCCAERQLPALLREQKGRAVLFQTYGDVTFENILRSVSCMAGNDHLTMTLAVREVTDKMQRILRHYQEREWITNLRLLISDTEGEAIVFEGTHGTVIIQGPVIDTRLPIAKLIFYAGQFTVNAASAPLAALLASRYRLQEKKAIEESKENEVPPAAEVNGLSSNNDKKPRTRETKKSNE